MLEKIDHHHFLILGFDKVKIADAEKTLRQLRTSFRNAQLQLLKADLIAGREHLLFAARNALQAFKGNNPISKSLAVELLLYVSCQRQISKAIRLLGVGPADERVVLVALSDSKDVLEGLAKAAGTVLAGYPADDLIEINTEKKAEELRKVYGVTSRELEAARFPAEKGTNVLKRLVIERSALLGLES